jgi:hypothetical protein
MSDKKVDKFFVGNEFRKNKLAEKDSPIIAEVHCPGRPIKSYTNIHYPKALAKKVFRESPMTTHIIFKNTINGFEETIENALHNGSK